MLTNHLSAPLAVARDPTIRIRDIAALLGVTERRIYRVIAELVEAALLSVTREGRRSVYSVDRDALLVLPVLGERTVGELLDLLPLQEFVALPDRERAPDTSRRARWVSELLGFRC
jgi:hypothetical protein